MGTALEGLHADEESRVRLGVGQGERRNPDVFFYVSYHLALSHSSKKKMSQQQLEALLGTLPHHIGGLKMHGLSMNQLDSLITSSLAEFEDHMQHTHPTGGAAVESEITAMGESLVERIQDVLQRQG